MRFLHISDLHLGFQTNAKEVNYDPFKSINFAFEYAINEGIKLILIPGDVFDRRDPPPFIQKGFASILSKAVKEGIEIFLITGNHEGSPFLERTIHLDVYRELEIPGVTISKTPNIFKIHGLNIISLPYPFKRNLLAKDEYRDKGEDEVLEILNRKLLNMESELLKKADLNLPTVLVAHLPILEGKMNEDTYSRFDTDSPIPIEELDREQFSYVALGHYHKMQVMISRKYGHPFVYSGSLERINFSEENDEKGFYDVEIDEKTRTSSFSFIRNPFARKFYTIEIHKMEDIERVDFEKAKESITRIVLFEDLENEQELKTLISKINETALAFTGILDKRERKSNFISSSFQLTISPKEAIEKYLKNKDDLFIKENMSKVLETAMDILREIQSEDKDN